MNNDDVYREYLLATSSPPPAPPVVPRQPLLKETEEEIRADIKRLMMIPKNFPGGSTQSNTQPAGRDVVELEQPPVPTEPDMVAVEAAVQAVGDFLGNAGMGVLKGIPEGLSKASQQIGDTFTGGFWSSHIEPYINKIPGVEAANTAMENALKTEGKVQEVAKSVSSPLSQVFIPGAFATRVAKAAGIGQRILAEALGYGIAEVATVDPKDKTLLELGLTALDMSPEWKTIFEQSLAAQEDDNAFMERIKNAPRRFLEGGAMGVVFERVLDGAGMLYRAVKESPVLKDGAAGLSLIPRRLGGARLTKGEYEELLKPSKKRKKWGQERKEAFREGVAEVNAVRQARLTRRTGLQGQDPLSAYGGSKGRLEAQRRAEVDAAEKTEKARLLEGRQKIYQDIPNQNLWNKKFRGEVNKAIEKMEYGGSASAAVNRANLEAIPRILKKDGWTVRHASSGAARKSSRYLVAPDGKYEVRLSDHYLPETPQREYSRSISAARWDDEIVLGGADDPQEIITQIKGLYADVGRHRHRPQKRGLFGIEAPAPDAPLPRVEPAQQSQAMKVAIENGSLTDVIRQAATEEQIKLTEKASKGLALLPDQHAVGDPNIAPSVDVLFTDRLDEVGTNFMKWVDYNGQGKFLHSNQKTAASIDFSTTCGKRSCSVGSCLYCYVDAGRVINKEGDRVIAAGGKIEDTGLGKRQAKTDKLEHNFDQAIFDKMPESVINGFNQDGGLRMFSFGDFREGVDEVNVQKTLDAAAKIGLNIKAITKSREFVEMFGDHPALRLNISMDNIPGDISNAFNRAEAIQMKTRYPNLRIRSVAVNSAEVEKFGKMVDDAGKPLIDVLTLYHGPTNFRLKTKDTPLDKVVMHLGRKSERTDVLYKVIMLKLDDPDFTPPGAKEQILKAYGGEEGFHKWLDTWENMETKTKVFKGFVEKFGKRMCCKTGKCSSDPDVNCGFGVVDDAAMKMIGFALGLAGAAYPELSRHDGDTDGS